MKIFFKLLVVAALALQPVISSAADDEYPHRSQYPDVQIYLLGKLKADYAKVTIVDVRSPYEFDTLHIKGAVNIPLHQADFSEQVQALASKQKRPIVFYCNGKTCSKSYKGARQAARAGLKKIYSFDAGVFDWAKANPKLTVLLGRSPVSPGDLISKDQLHARMLSAKEFERRVNAGGKISVLDVRDRIQRDILLFPFKETRISLNEEKKLNEFLRRESRAGKTLLIYDKVGKQVRWLQYRLQALGIKHYYFMKGGSEAMYKAI